MAPPPPSRESTIPNDQRLFLPPLHPPPSKGSPPAPVVYTIRLSDDVAKSLLVANSPTIKFNTATNGILSVPNLRDIPFVARAISDANAETARAACYSRRGKSLRSVGPIVASIDIQQQLSKNLASATKKRSLEASNARAREVPVINDRDLPLPPKRQKLAKAAAGKRPRAPARRHSTPAQPPASLARAKPPPPALGPAPTAAPMLLRSAPPPQSHAPSAAAAAALISPASPLSPPASAAPNVALPHPLRNPYNPPKRPAPATRSSLSAMQPRRGAASPTTLPAPALPRPAPRRHSAAPTPPSSTLRAAGSHVSPNGSRGPSPLRNPASASSPANSLAGQKRRRPEDLDRRADLRRAVIHALALGDMQLPTLRRKLRLDDPSDTPAASALLSDVLSEVADKRAGAFSLKDAAWGDVSVNFPSFSDNERTRVKVLKSDRCPSSILGGESLTPGVASDAATAASCAATMLMTEASLDDMLKKFNAEEAGRRVEQVTSDEEERRLRKRYREWFPVYQVLLERMSEMKQSFGNLEKRFLDAKSSREREAVVSNIKAAHEKFRSRHQRLCKMLPLLHDRLRELRTAIERRAKMDGA